MSEDWRVKIKKESDFTFRGQMVIKTAWMYESLMLTEFCRL